MRHFFSAFLGMAMFVSVPVQADQNSDSNLVDPSVLTYSPVANVNKGNWQIGGQMVGSGGNGSFAWLSAQAQYFFVHRVSAGLSTDFAYTSADGFVPRSLNVGPVITYHFWSSEKWVANLSQSLTYSSNLEGLITSLGLGFNYFLAPTVGIGPAARYSFDLSPISVNSPSLYVNLSVFL